MTAKREELTSDALVGPVIAAMQADRQDRIEAWRADVLAALRGMIAAAPHDLSVRAVHADDPGELDPAAAAQYRLAAEFVRLFPERQTAADASAMSRGFLLDFWDEWWRSASGVKTGGEALQIETHLEAAEGDGYGRLVRPELIRDALCECDGDLARLLAPGGYGGDSEMLAQAEWLLRRLHRTGFRSDDRQTLYELLRLRHWRTASREHHFAGDTVRTLVETAAASDLSIAKRGSTPMPQSPEAAFIDDGEAVRTEERLLAIELIQAFVSCTLAPEGTFDKFPQMVEAAAQGFELQPDSGRFPGPDTLRGLALCLAAGSRMIRHALDDLLGYRFPVPVPYNPPQLEEPSNCDCWLSILGHRQTGKTSFMTSLAAALHREDIPLDQTANLSGSRARIVTADAFRQSIDRKDVLARSDSRSVMEGWLGGRTRPTAQRLDCIAEVDTAQMARFTFFDLAGEQIFRRDEERISDDITALLEARKPVAGLFIDAEPYPDDDAIDEQTGRTEYDLVMEERAHTRYEIAAQVIADSHAPIYIIVNKADRILENYTGAAREELERSFRIGREGDAPQLHDADAPVPQDDDAAGPQRWPFVTLRGHFPIPEPSRDLPLPDIRHEDVVQRLEADPSLARRPYFKARVIEDIRRLGNLFDALLRAGRRDISLVYLVSTPYREKRKTSGDFGGLLDLWDDIEAQVIHRTVNARRDGVRKMLVTDPKEQEKKAGECFAAFDPLFSLARNKLRALVETKAPSEPDEAGRLSSDWKDFYVKLDKAVDEEDRIDRVKQAWCRTSVAIKARRDAVRTIDTVLRDFLHELGIDPNGSFAALTDGHLSIVLDEAERKRFEALIESVTIELQRQVQPENASLREPEAVRTEIGRMLRSIVMGFGNENAGMRAASLVPGAFTQVAFNLESGGESGVRPPVGDAVGSRVLDRRLSLGDRDVLERSNGTFGAAILSPQNATETAIGLVRVLRNIARPSAARYPQLALGIGDQDFVHVRVLTEELKDRFLEFRDCALKVIESLINAKKRLESIDDDTIARISMGRALHKALPEVQLPPVDEFIRPRGGDDALISEWQTFVDAAKAFQNDIINQRSNRQNMSLISGLRIKFRGEEFVNILKFKPEHGPTNAEVWRRLHKPSYDQVHDATTTRDDEPTVRNAVGTIRTRIELLDKLVETASSLNNNTTEGQFNDVLKFMENPDEGLSDPIRADLVRLRLLRRWLLRAYPLKYLLMSGIVQNATDLPTGNGDIERHRKADLRSALVDAAIALDRWLSRKIEQGANQDSHQVPSIGNPKPADAEMADQAKDTHKTLCMLLGLLPKQNDPDPLWGESIPEPAGDP